eukprot:Amastigsp_a842286_375.p5 type:complete len:112 gc:universal Amastigsp_a842286_375:548-883(+)
MCACSREPRAPEAVPDKDRCAPRSHRVAALRIAADTCGRRSRTREHSRACRTVGGENKTRTCRSQRARSTSRRRRNRLLSRMETPQPRARRARETRKRAQGELGVRVRQAA